MVARRLLTRLNMGVAPDEAHGLHDPSRASTSAGRLAQPRFTREREREEIESEAIRAAD